MSACRHADWTCFYERVSDGKRLAYCQRCGMQGDWQWTMAAAETALAVYPVRPDETGSAEIFTRPA